MAETVQKIESLKAESLKYVRISNESRPRISLKTEFY